MAKEKKTEEVQTNSNQIQIKWASLHAGTDFPGAMPSQTTLHEVKVPGIKMYIDRELSQFLFVELKGRKYAVPLAGVKSVEFNT